MRRTQPVTNSARFVGATIVYDDNLKIGEIFWKFLQRVLYYPLNIFVLVVSGNGNGEARAGVLGGDHQEEYSPS